MKVDDLPSGSYATGLTISPSVLAQWPRGRVIVHVPLNRAAWNFFLCPAERDSSIQISRALASQLNAKVCAHCAATLNRQRRHSDGVNE